VIGVQTQEEDISWINNFSEKYCGFLLKIKSACEKIKETKLR
jgi:hypothetical protein